MCFSQRTPYCSLMLFANSASAVWKSSPHIYPNNAAPQNPVSSSILW